MNVLVDTSVWSLALRRRVDAGEKGKAELAALIDEGRVAIIGAIRQEILSGVRAREEFRKLRDGLRAFIDLRLDRMDFENAAACFNECRARGVQGSNTDFLICAVALRRDLSVFSTDSDFDGYSRVLGVKLHEAR